MKINIFKNTIISKDDVNIIEYLVNNIKWDTIETEFEIKTYKHENVNIGYADLNIHLDIISPIGLNLSNYNLLIPDLEMYNKNQNDYLSKINLVLYKTRQEQEKFKEIIDKPISAKYLGMITPERLDKSTDFLAKNNIDICTLMHDENKNEVIELAKSWSYIKKFKIYTYLTSDDCLLDIIGLKNVEILFDLGKMYTDNSCYIQIGTPVINIILENMCCGNVIFYRDNIDHEYLSTCNGFVEYNLANIYNKLDNLSIQNSSITARKTFTNLTLDFIKNFKKIFNNIFSSLVPYEPILNELPEDLPIISLISKNKNNLLERWFDNLDYPKDKLEWLVNEDLQVSINNSKGEYVMLFDLNFYYNPQCIKNRLIIIRDKDCVYCAIKPNYNYIRKISSIIIEPVTKKYRDRIVEGSLFLKRHFWNSDWDFNKMIEINWVGVFIGIDTSLNINSEPNGCHFNIEGGMDLDTVEYLNKYRA
jgi:hypothetical protein